MNDLFVLLHRRGRVIGPFASRQLAFYYREGMDLTDRQMYAFEIVKLEAPANYVFVTRN